MTRFSRRLFLAGAGSSTLLAACTTTGVPKLGSAREIEARVDETLNFLYTTYPRTRQVRDRSVAQLVMPLVTKAGFFVGGSYGRGALRIDGVTEQYYSAASGSLGYQIGAQQYSHVLFFMTQEALRRFRTSPGWSVDAEAEFAFLDAGGNLSAQSLDTESGVIAFVFGQAGLAVGASLEGTKYTPINPGA